MIRSQLERGNSHHAYAWLLLKDGIFADEAERWALIERYLLLAPKNFRFTLLFLAWAKNASPERAKAEAKKLLEVDGQHPFAVVAVAALKALDKEEAKPFARKLLEVDGQITDVICTALNLLDKEEAKPFAKKMLEKSEQIKEGIIFVALRILENDAEDFAKRILYNWHNEDFRIVVRCLHIISTSEKAEQIVSSILMNKMDKKRYYAVLKFPLHPIPSWWKETISIIQNWKKNTAITVANVLRHYLADKEFLEIHAVKS